jgi:hypothetical protein
MQIPYDLEFVENRPAIAARAVALREPIVALRAGRPGREHDAMDALLQWVFRMLRRFEK